MDWICDECKKPESEVGSLIHGRLKSGRDYQLCKSCRPMFYEKLKMNERFVHSLWDYNEAKSACIKIGNTGL